MYDLRFMNGKADKHVILIGFKNAGKTVIGRRLAERLGRKFADLDAEIEKREGVRVREMVQKNGEPKLRKLESVQLKRVLASPEPLVLALGGGTPMLGENQKLIAEHTVVLVTGRKDLIFSRIMRNGRPPFFPRKGSDREAFENIYGQREPVYERLAMVKVKNNGTVEEAVEEIIKNLES